jgi:hypothetical protein
MQQEAAALAAAFTCKSAKNRVPEGFNQSTKLPYDCTTTWHGYCILDSVDVKGVHDEA